MSINPRYYGCVFTSSKERATNKLEEIYVIKGSPEYVKRIYSLSGATYVYEDSEWRWVSPSCTARGMRLNEVWIDLETPNSIIEEVILPSCIGDNSTVHFF